MIVTVLGCGGSGGVPMVGNQWGSCDPANPKNIRTRSSIFVKEGETGLLIDTSPDLRQQMLREDITSLSAVLYTHAHADHCHGIDDLRSLNWLMKGPIDIYADQLTIEKLTVRFDYIFRAKPGMENYYKPALKPHVIEGPLQFGNLTVLPFEQDHTFMKTLGFRVGNFAYTTDAKTLDEAAFAALKGVEIWIVDCVSYEPHPTHSHLAQTLEWINQIKPKMAYLTHMGYRLDYEKLCKELPATIRPAYDGLKITL
jgi:phosphoribosyl 1,2-cyclic phosphate phosphodiesterase